MQILVDDLTGPEIAAFLDEHIGEMRLVSPPESKHALDLEGLRQPEITFWTVWRDGALVGCGALKELESLHGEIKSMRVCANARNEGVASHLLQHIISEAKQRGYLRLSLETGSTKFFEPARKLYEGFGFNFSGPFSSYKEDPNSIFMFLDL